MKSHNWHGFLLILFICLILVLSLAPGNGQSGSIPHLDKIGHFAMYAGLAYLSGLFFISKKSKYLSWISGVLLGILLEFLQSFIPGREFSFTDMIANTAGEFLGAFWVLYMSTRN